MSASVEAAVRRANAVVTDEAIDELFGPDVSSRLLADIHAKRDPHITVPGLTTAETDEQPLPAEIAVMTVVEEEAMSPANRKRTVLLGAAAAIVLIVGVWIAARAGSDDSAPTITDDVEVPDTVAPTPVEMSPVEMAHAFIDAQNAYDSDAVLALLSENAEIVGDPGAGSLDQLAVELDLSRAMGWHEFDVDCQEVAAGPPVQVRCDYTFENAWSRALGDGPYTGSSYRFEIADGRIQVASDRFQWVAFTRRAWAPFRDWVRETHPDSFDAMYTRSEGSIARRTAEAVELFDRYTTEFVASLTDG